MCEKAVRPVPQISDAQLAFPVDVYKLAPAESDIPGAFWDRFSQRNAWVKIAEAIFFGGKRPRLKAKAGVDGAAAVRFIQALLRSYEPKHERKMATVGFLLSEWFDIVADAEAAR